MAERPKKEEAAKAPASTLDERGRRLQALIQETLKGVELQAGACLDIPEIKVRPQDIVRVCRTLKEEPALAFKMLLCLCIVDYRDYFQVVYVLLSLEHEHKAIIKVDLPYEESRLPTVSGVWRAADWYEREAHDLFGVAFEGHPGLEPLLLYQGFEGYPGRKGFPFHDYQEW